MIQNEETYMNESMELMVMSLHEQYRLHSLYKVFILFNLKTNYFTP